MRHHTRREPWTWRWRLTARGHAAIPNWVLFDVRAAAVGAREATPGRDRRARCATTLAGRVGAARLPRRGPGRRERVSRRRNGARAGRTVVVALVRALVVAIVCSPRGGRPASPTRSLSHNE